MTELYRNSGLEIYEKSHYSHGEHITEVEQILRWYRRRKARVLDIGCSGGLHALEFSKRGFPVTGMDIEPSAIKLAKKRASSGNQKAKFLVLDIGKDELPCAEKFDFIYSIGNVLSHVKKDHIFEVLKKICDCLDEKGILLFDVLMNSKPFQEELYPKENELQIIWKRKIDEKTGRISMDGIFLESGFIQHFDVWGYTVEEITRILNSLGFGKVEYSPKLDFISKNKTKNTISLYFRAERT